MSIRSRRGFLRPTLTNTLQTAALAAGLLAGTAASAAAPVMTVSQLNVYRDGDSSNWLLGQNRWLADGFDNGAPLAGPAYAGTTDAARYQLEGEVAGTDPAALAWESGSALHLDATQAALAPNARGQIGRSVRLVLGTDTTEWEQGFTQSRSFSASIRLSLDSLPAAGQSFGLRFTDGFSNRNDYVELSVFSDAAGSWLQLRKQDFVLDTITPIATTALTPLAGASQLVLSLAHGTPGSNLISGSYSFANAQGALLTSFTGLGSATAFNDETATRLELRATAPVPEPASWLLLAGGGLLLAARRARRG